MGIKPYANDHSIDLRYFEHIVLEVLGDMVLLKREDKDSIFCALF